MAFAHFEVFPGVIKFSNPAYLSSNNSCSAVVKKTLATLSSQ